MTALYDPNAPLLSTLIAGMMAAPPLEYDMPGENEQPDPDEGDGVEMTKATRDCGPVAFQSADAASSPDSTLPRVPISNVYRARDGVWVLKVSHCPLCGAKHQHGGGTGDEPSFGAKLSHCRNGKGGAYELVPGGGE